MIGTQQRWLLRLMREGLDLYQENGQWYTSNDGRVLLSRRAESCMGLYAKGYIMAAETTHQDDLGPYRTRYVLTEKGKSAI